MLFPGFVVAEEFALENVFEEFAGDDPSGAFLGLSALGGELQCVVGGASVAVCEGGDAKKNVVRHFGRFVAAAWHGQQAARFVGEGAAKQLDDLRSGERFEDVHLGAGQKRRDDFKGGIFGGSANESDMAGFDVRRSEEHTSELQSRLHLVCRLLLEKKTRSDYSTSSTTTPAR